MTLTPDAVSDEDLDRIERINKPFDPGPCRVCGETLDVQAVGPGTLVAWAHSVPSGVSYRDWADHYGDSRVETYSPGDSTLTAMVSEVRASRVRLALAAHLHRRETRYTIEATEEYTSYATLAEAKEAWEEYHAPVADDDPERPEFRYDQFDLCHECSENVRREMDTNGIDEWGYSEQWPCRTAIALGVAEVPPVS